MNTWILVLTVIVNSGNSSAPTVATTTLKLHSQEDCHLVGKAHSTQANGVQYRYGVRVLYTCTPVKGNKE